MVERTKSGLCAPSKILSQQRTHATLEPTDIDGIRKTSDFPDDNNDAGCGAERYLASWRSPDDPSPCEFVHKIQNRGLAEVVTLRGATKRYKVGPWNGNYFGGPRFPNAFSYSHLVKGLQPVRVLEKFCFP